METVDNIVTDNRGGNCRCDFIPRYATSIILDRRAERTSAIVFTIGMSGKSSHRYILRCELKYAEMMVNEIAAIDIPEISHYVLSPVLATFLTRILRTRRGRSLYGDTRLKSSPDAHKKNVSSEDSHRRLYPVAA